MAYFQGPTVNLPEGNPIQSRSIPFNPIKSHYLYITYYNYNWWASSGGLPKSPHCHPVGLAVARPHLDGGDSRGYPASKS